ncbi:hypothetical protein [Butyrivibrio fibrisolvens]|uniref:hypothetical protein n=1 Tax=Butyrivibrio fibrisolvens TaxID=831 RepID=UPI00042347F3|nr:hypothetical protein [Butyrivibrio fibrisolvens]
MVHINPLNLVYLQVPQANNSNKCPFCGMPAKQEPITIIVCQKPNFTKKIQVTMGYCVKCKIPFTDYGINKNVEKLYSGFEVQSFFSSDLKKAKARIRKYSDKNYLPGNTRRLIDSEIINNTVSKPKSIKQKYNTARKQKSIIFKYNTLERVKGNFFTYNKIVDVEKSWQWYDGVVSFVKCSNPKMLYDFYNNPTTENVTLLIPCDDRKKALQINANYSEEKEIFFIDKSLSEMIIESVKDTQYKSKYYIDNKKINDIVVLRKHKENVAGNDYWKNEIIDSVVITVFVDFKDGTSGTFRITNKRKDQDIENRVFHYSTSIAREVLTASFHENRHRNGQVWDKDFTVTKILKRETENYNYTFFLQSYILFQTGGGLNSSVKNRFKEIVTVLLYSPISDRYECINMTYDKKENYCYVDPGIFRKHIKEYGDPGLQFRFNRSDYSKDNRDWSYYDLSSESVLHCFGYNVNEQNGLSDKARHEILADIMDLDILSASKIIGLLEFFKNTHTRDIYNLARAKWDNDITFVKSYKINPKRFLISENNN